MVGKNLIFLGAPGVGKGTLAIELSKIKNMRHISTGDIFRKEITMQTPLGLKVKEILESGEYVPDEITNEIVLKALSDTSLPSHGFILDGYPRTINQANFLQENHIHIDYVIVIEVPFPIILKRLLSRGRSDDNKEIIQHRYEVYNEKTKVLIDFYEKQGLVKRIDASGSVEENLAKLIKGIY